METTKNLGNCETEDYINAETLDDYDRALIYLAKINNDPRIIQAIALIRDAALDQDARQQKRPSRHRVGTRQYLDAVLELMEKDKPYTFEELQGIMEQAGYTKTMYRSSTMIKRWLGRPEFTFEEVKRGGGTIPSNIRKIM